jgi:hypothetical protein
MSPEAWAGWAQAVGSVVAILGAAWGVHRAHQLQLRADRSRELRQMALEVEAVEVLLAEIQVQLQAVELATVDIEAFSEHMTKPETRQGLTEAKQALELVRPAFAGKPHMALSFVRAHNAVEDAVIAFERSLPSAAVPSGSVELARASSRRGLADLRDVVQLMRDTRETYQALARGKAELED